MNTNLAGRFVGRLFVESGRLCLVVEIDEEAGIGRVSSRVDGEQQLNDMPLADIARCISANSDLALDNVGESAPKRIVRKDDGWYFNSREGLQGPYLKGEEAEAALKQHIISSQGENSTRAA